MKHVCCTYLSGIYHKLKIYKNNNIVCCKTVSDNIYQQRTEMMLIYKNIFGNICKYRINMLKQDTNN